MLSKPRFSFRVAAVALLTALVLFSMARTPRPDSSVFHPKKPADLAQVSAYIVMERSAGTGTLLRSGPGGSDFLTNEHVCNGAKKSGSLVILNRQPYMVTAIKPSAKSDLCLMHVKEDLGISTEIAPKPPALGDEVMAGGYPLSLPLVIQKGFVSEVMNIGEKRAEWVLVTSIMVQHGSSGTGVFNAQGQLVGVLEAFRSDEKTDSIGFGLAVPQQYVKRFVEKEAPRLPWTAVPRARP